MSRTLVLAGGGLSSCLIAWRVLREDPDFDLVILERGERLGGNHTWCFHGADLDAAAHEWMAPLVAHHWPHQSVRFPDLERRLDTTYHCVTSERLHEALAPLLGERLRLGVTIDAVTPEAVTLADGTRVTGDAVVDARGPRPSPHLVLRFQKFLGQQVLLERPHGLTGPIIMDASVEQRDGYRFVYVLPFSERGALIEDTYYTDAGDLSHEVLRTSIEAYARGRGWTIASVEREEEGVLPILLGGDHAAFWREAPRGIAQVGLRGALFHPTTGYSLPDAVRVADVVAAALPAPGARLDALVRAHASATWRRHGVFRMLNRMMFLAGAPDSRYRILERFYRLPLSLVERFYAGRLSALDHVRLLTGKPPVPLIAGLRTAATTDACVLAAMPDARSKR